MACLGAVNSGEISSAVYSGAVIACEDAPTGRKLIPLSICFTFNIDTVDTVQTHHMLNKHVLSKEVI